MKLKIYLIGNYDGTRSALVAATNKQEARKALGVSKNVITNETVTRETTMFTFAKNRPGVVFVRPISSPTSPWTPLKKNQE